MPHTKAPNALQKKHVTIAQKELGHYLDQIKDEERAKVRNNFLLYCLAIMSSIGLFYVLTAKPSTNTVLYPPVYANNAPTTEENLNTTNTIRPSIKKNTPAFATNPTKEDLNDNTVPQKIETSFSIEAEAKEANEPIYFSFKGLQNDYQYTLHLGNGAILDVNSSKVSYIYTKHGIYKVTLKMKNPNNNEQIVASKEIQIAPSIEVESHKN
jgi:hypothetical protein